jgi:BirA family biotin operon repressor/biotin-[acetyl-CoA-carboxylase] ligase
MPSSDRAGDSALSLKTRPLCMRAVEQGLAPSLLGTRFHYCLEIDSTNDYARALAEAGEPQGTIVIAEQQTKGRGRLGRHWVSPPFLNLYCSVILRPSLPPAHAPRITLMAAVALADAVEECGAPLPAIKWPNDILVGRKKLAGILTEAVSNAQRVQFVVLGIGVNLNFMRALMPAEICERATSLADVVGKTVSREAFLRRLIHHLDRCYGVLEERGFGPLAARWDARFQLRGRLVRVESGERRLVGRAIGIDADGALVIGAADGSRERILAGDVLPIEE